MSEQRVRGHEVVDFARLPGVACPFGTAHRAFAGAADFPATIHRTEISAEARRHYHKGLTEAYYVLECEAGAYLELDGERVAALPGLCVLIRPGTRHRAVGRMTVLIVVVPKYDPSDEWFDDEPGAAPGE
jgi:mannose-6-phosphate isomerase-like protein (cupin superfamily)